MISFMSNVELPGASTASRPTGRLPGLGLRVVDRDRPLHLHEQVAGEIRRAIASGEAGPGDRLPQAKDLAAVLGVNTNTVLRALRQLRDDGVVEMGRGRATVVAHAPDRGIVVAKAREIVDLAFTHGYTCNELLGLIEQIYEESPRP